MRPTSRRSTCGTVVPVQPDPRPGRRGGDALPARPWAQAWQEALYGRHGFYRTYAPAQHFHTSAQGIPGAGRVLAEALAALCRRHGLDRVVDLGAGRGELLARVRQLAPDLRLHGVDVVDRPAGAAVDRWTRSPGGGASLPSELRDLRSVLVLAHEWLDVVPCPVVARDGQGVWRGLAVGADGTEVLGPPLAGADLAWAQRWLGPRVRRAEVGRPRDLAAEDLVGRVVDGVVVLVDYGHEAADRPTDGTLTGYRAGRQVDPVPDGRRDLTAHVAWDSLVDRLRGPGRGGRRVEVTATTQREALLDLLSDDGSDPLAPVPHRLARADPAAYLDLVARRAALTALTAPGGLGDFRWALVRVPGASGADPSRDPAAGRERRSSH